MSYDERRNLHILLTSANKVDNRTLTLVWDEPFIKGHPGLKNNTDNIGVYPSRLFCVRSGFTIYLFTNIHVEEKENIVEVD